MKTSSRIVLAVIVIALMFGIGVIVYYQITPPPPIFTNQTTEKDCTEKICGDVSTAETAIKQLLATKYNKTVADIQLRFSEATDSHARGGVSFAPFDQGNTGMFLATTVNADHQWQLVYDGNGSVDCVDLSQYDFPSSMMEGVCD